MKKFNVVAAFWLLLALIAFVIFATAFSGLWNTLSSAWFPYPEATRDPAGMVRSLTSTIPMLILGLIVFFVGMVKGLRSAREHSESE